MKLRPPAGIPHCPVGCGVSRALRSRPDRVRVGVPFVEGCVDGVEIHLDGTIAAFGWSKDLDYFRCSLSLTIGGVSGRRRTHTGSGDPILPRSSVQAGVLRRNRRVGETSTSKGRTRNLARGERL